MSEWKEYIFNRGLAIVLNALLTGFALGYLVNELL